MSALSVTPSSEPAFLAGGGAVGAVMRGHDWTRTPLGPPAGWPAPLRRAVRLVLDARQPMYIGWGPELLSLYNDGYVPICGARHPAGLGQPMRDLWAEVWPQIEPVIAAACDGEGQAFEDVPFQLSGRSQPGPAWFSFSCTPLRDDDHAVAGLLFVATETTERVRLQRRQQEEIRVQRRLFEQAPGFVFTVAGPGHVVEFANAAQRQLADGADPTGRPVAEAFPALCTPAFLKALAHAWDTGERCTLPDVQVATRIAPGAPPTSRRLDFVLAPLVDDDGRVTGLFCEGQDVTDARAAIVSLREREEQLRLATEAGDISLWDVDMLAGTLYWPRRVRAMFGMSSDRPVTLDDFRAGLHPEDAPAVMAAFEAACDPLRRAPYDVEFRTVGFDDGRIRWVAAKGRALFDAEGCCRRVIGTAIDITARKAVEMALRESEERLRESDRRKDEFIATLAHELRNPLAPLRNALEVRRLQGAPDRLDELMRRQVDHLVRLVDDLLELSRISRGAFELRRERMDLRDAARAAVEAVDPLLRERRHRLDLWLPDHEVPVDGDVVRLTQILANLINNAARYTPVEGRLSLRVDGGAVPGEDVRAIVSDSGNGFDGRQAERLFAMFHRGPQSSGLGVGLALSRRLAEMHGGTLAGSSEGPGQGAAFTLRLPVGAAAVPPGPSTVPVPGSIRPGLRVVVADDNEDAADALEVLLRRLQADVRVARDGTEALDLVSSFPPDLLLLDIGMPRMDGYEVARRLRARPGGDALLIVALSGWGQEEDRRRGREAGFDHHLVKPADIQALRRLLALASEDPAVAKRGGVIETG